MKKLCQIIFVSLVVVGCESTSSEAACQTATNLHFTNCRVVDTEFFTECGRDYRHGYKMTAVLNGETMFLYTCCSALYGCMTRAR